MEAQGGEGAVRPLDDGKQGVILHVRKPHRGLSRALLIVGVFFAVVGAAMAITSVTIREPAIPPGTLPEVLNMQALDDPAGLSADGIIAYQNDPYGFDVSFAEQNVDPPTQPGTTPFLQSIDGDWYGNDAHLSVDGTDRGAVAPATTEAGWGDSLPDHAERAVSPTLHVSFPISASDLHKSLVVTAQMRVHVPYKVGDKGFSVAGGTVRKTATLFVVSPEERQLRKGLDDWKDRGRTGSSGLITLVFGGALALGGLALRRRGRSTV